MTSRDAVLDWFLPVGLAVVLVAILWAPVLFDGKILVPADAIMLGAPLMDLGARALQGTAELAWSPDVYGGHPVFAEGQGAFADPLVLLFARWVTPAVGAARSASIIHCLFIALGAVGMTGLCRSVGLGRWGSCLAVVAAIFSPDWVWDQHNLPVSATAMWVPWLLWTGEIWLARPGWRSACFLGVIAALMLLSGYPQTLHATTLYLLVRGTMMLAGRPGRAALRANWRLRLATGVFAVLLACALAAIQLLPLLQLTGESYRDGGVGLIFQSAGSNFLNGLLYDVTSRSVQLINTPTVGSVLVMALFLVGFSRMGEPPVPAHLVATFLLFNLGMGTGSPIFRALYDWHLVPGMHFFRMTFANMNPAIVGIGLIAGWGAERLAHRLVRSSPSRAMVFAGSVAVVLGLSIMRLRAWEEPALQFGVLGAAVLGSILLLGVRKPALTPPLLAVLVVVEMLGLRGKPFAFFDAGLVAEPATIQAIRQRPDWRDFKLFDDTHSMLFAFYNRHLPIDGVGMRRALTAGTALTPVFWSLPAMTGHLALPQKRRMMMEGQLYAEAAGQSPLPVGARLIDLLGVGYISEEAPSTFPWLELVAHADDGIWIYRNTAARPRFQFFDRAIGATTPEAALATLERQTGPVLVVEAADGAFPAGSLDAPAAPPGMPPRLTVNDEKATAYDLLTVTAAPSWLFLADANYPGWTASIDGAPTRLYTGQLLGKAVWVPAGVHQVGMNFKSRPFVSGRAISIASLALLLIAGLLTGWRWRGWAGRARLGSAVGRHPAPAANPRSSPGRASAPRSFR